MKLIYPVCLYPGERSGYTAVVPDLPGCVTQGNTMEEALEMAIDAASGWVLDELEDGREIPRASAVNNIKADEYSGGIVSIIRLDMDEYSSKYGSQPVNVSCAIPAYLNTRAKNNAVNYSRLLRESLEDRLYANQ